MQRLDLSAKALLILISITIPSACLRVQKDRKGTDNDTKLASVEGNESTSSSAGSLARLTINIDELEPAFAPEILSYQLKNGTTPHIRYRINAFPSEAAQIVKVAGKKLPEDFTSELLPLNAGANQVNITVHDGEDRLLKSYRIDIQRAAELLDGELSGLAVSMGMITPDFHPDVLSYALTVPVQYSVLTISPQLPYAELATLEINGRTVDVFEGSYDIELVPGANPVSIRITGKSGKSKLYRLDVTRPRS